MRYYPKNLDGLPQYIAGLTFYPMGLFFGYYLNLFYLNRGTEKLLNEVTVLPICAGVISAGITAFIQVAIKIMYKKYVFEHFYLLIIGLFNIFVGGIIISSNENDVSSSLFICFIGHGICYVTILTYVNIRTSKSDKRFLKISIFGLAYLIGIAIGSYCTITKVKLETDNLSAFEDVNEAIGSQITLTSSFILVCYFVNEVLHWINSFDYKTSLDPDIHRENSKQMLLLDKYFYATRNDGCTPISYRYEAKFPVKRKTRAFFFIISNVIPIAYFYFPFIYFNAYINSNNTFYHIFWFGVLGYGLSLVVQYFFTNRIVFFIAIVVKLFGLCLFLLLLEILLPASHQILLYGLFCILGFHFQANDVNILSYGSLKYVEIEIFVSYMFQYITIGIIQYMTIMEPKYFFNFDLVITFSLHQGLFLIGLFSGAIFLAAYVLPKGAHISLLEIKNIIYHRKPPVLITHMLPVLQQAANSNNQWLQQLHLYSSNGCHQVNSQPYR